jgi:hypothetical protein
MFFDGLGVVAALALTFGQAASQQVVGTWIMSLRGETCARLELQTTNGTLSGRISLGSVHVDDQGDVDRVLAPATNYTPLFDIVNRDGVLFFARKDGDDTDRFELRVTGDTAQLTFLLTDEFRQQVKDDGIAAPKPITLTRTRP